MDSRSKFGGNNPMPRGFSLIEVLVAVVVLSVGLLALAALQGSLVRGGSAAKAQTQAMALAQQTLEQFRGFKTKTGGSDSYAAIVAGTDSVTIGANTYTRTVAVDRYGYVANTGASGGSFKTTASTTVGNNEFKNVTVAVSWTDETGQTRTVQEADVISVSAPADSLSALTSPSSSHQGPKVYIDPSKFAPGVIPIALGNNQSAAASDPQPESFSTGNITTRFSVQNYSTSDTSNGYDLLNKQFDFGLTSCTCNMSTTSTSANPAYAPTYWNGTKYIAPSTMVGKQTGSDPVSNGNPSNSTQDPVLCNACCRDHHDMASTAAQPYPVKFDEFRPATEYVSNDHKHYNTNSNNILQTAVVSTGSGTEYYETCRFVRVDGINYVATDARAENHILVAPLSPITISKTQVSCDPTGDSITPGLCYDHALDTTTSGTTYPNFVTDYVTAWYNAWKADTGYPTDEGTAIGDLLVSGGAPSSLATKYQTLINPVPVSPATQTAISLASGSTTASYMEARAIYIDNISSETSAALACVGSTDPDCTNYKDLTPLQILPFVAVNLTYLDSWSSSDTSNSSPVSIKSDQIPTTGTYDPYVTGYTFDRGTALAGTSAGSANALANLRPGNAGLIDSMTVSASYPMEAFTYTSSGSPPTYTYTSNTQFVTDQQKYTITAPVVNPTFTLAISKPSGNAGKNFGSVQPAAQSPSPGQPSTIITTPTTCTSKNNSYTCTGAAGSATILLAFTNYNTTCTKNCTVTVNDYKLCSISGLPGSVTLTTGYPFDVVNSGLANEATYAELSVAGGSPDSIVSTLSLTATFALGTAACP